MLSKLTIRNVKRSTKDYLIYIVTMSIVSALMFAFNGMMFSDDMKVIYQEMEVFIALTGVSTVFIIIIVIWLVHYMVHFMMERRSREFGTYLLLGMKKKQIASIFRRENLLLAFISLMIGMVLGTFFQIAFTNVFYSILDVEYKFSPDFSPWNVLLTYGLLLLSNILALLRVKRKFKKMSINSLIYMDRQNEKAQNEKSTWKKYFVFISIAYIVVFNILALTSNMTINSVWGYIAGLVAAIYFLYIGLSSYFVSYIKKRHKGVYKEANIFVFRQLSSKIKTMRFTMGTLTILFTTALLGCMLVMMFADYQNRQVEQNLPFDVMVFSDKEEYSFEKELSIITEDSNIKDKHIYSIYENGTDDMNEYLYENLDGAWWDDEGTYTYFDYDTYIGLSDYNYIRSMIGYKTVTLNENSYLIQCEERAKPHLEQFAKTNSVIIGGENLEFKETYTEPLAQSGMNGADYLIVVPDAFLSDISPYYSLLMVSLDGKAPDDLQERLKAVQSYYDENGDYNFRIRYGHGSDQVINFSDPIQVKDNAIVESSFVIVYICFIMAYISIVFLCTSLTILAVQQLSDSSKYKFRYSILKQLGLSKKETDRVVFKQLGIYYLCPFVISIALSMFIGMFASERFVYYTGIQAGIFKYYILSVLVFAVVYIVYFIVTYVGFLRNINK